METAGYATLSRQTGLMREMRVVANNIANSATTGYRSEGLIFSEYVQSAPGQQSMSMARANIHNTSMEQGQLTKTNGTFDFAIEGDAFFMVETPQGQRLTRSGAFSSNAQGDLVTMDGHRVMDAGGAPLFVPTDAESFQVGSDGTLSADGQPLGQIGLFKPVEMHTMSREDGVMFRVDGEIEPALESRVLQGFLEGSNVNAIQQVSRMIEIQRAYEMGQSFLTTEDERIRAAIKNLIK
ncbi:flagellar hook-basal body complex protein [Phaeobacter gallaeciensis]|uniref:flagellar hook-basal body complex protein n=1 Tax=Phaeobacter gallaeciensis TaxID=60890 RepID=UPI00237FBF43|nr:flagellar hook-basal body complex protein [Phaeobacter gallaeciensis]MDE4192840.1 flagellar hook-basal body complex protein [Phaeobacter gallaeciensis]MDE4198458.1 flagellar hook-basal body complex protein [Phaeobacter gallaeciensis]MDE4202603.1 flagellar hook-basal body complex protein [Phaeobacter gallaeciensis]MDE4206101.1 flagellar hook-basal body complex protein [Phaeobacter gallaeciensis]MDE4214468.1 flagellar hook-basal body complex protein [Phaeobacter gallaeciensis]